MQNKESDEKENLQYEDLNKGDPLVKESVHKDKTEDDGKVENLDDHDVDGPCIVSELVDYSENEQMNFLIGQSSGLVPSTKSSFDLVSFPHYSNWNSKTAFKILLWLMERKSWARKNLSKQ